MSLAEEFMDLYLGSDQAHGTTTVGRIGRNGKAEADSKVIRKPMKLRDVEGHLAGTQGIGGIPINSENECRFAVLDIDDYDLDLSALVAKVNQMNLPLITCRSKSGGAHLYMFLKEFTSARLVREYMTELSAAIGFAGREIFPKQDEILSDRGDVGNFINLPYFNADQSMRYALASHNAKAMSLEDFIEKAKSMRVNLADLEPLLLRDQESNELKDYPPCIRRIVAAGGFSVNRNESLMHSVIAIRKQNPDDWKPAVEEFNNRYMQPPLPAAEVATIQNQHAKKEYGFKCEVNPMKDHCDKTLCRQAKYGIGRGGKLIPVLTGLTILESNPRLYHLNVNGKRMELTLDELNTSRGFQRKCLEVLNIRPDLQKDSDWNVIVNELLTNATVIPAPAELTLEGQFRDYLEDFCTSRIKAMAPEEVNMGKPWTENGVTMFKIVALMDYLKKKDFTALNRPQVQEYRKNLNDGRDCHGHMMIKKEDGARTSVRVWKIPAFDGTEIKLELDDGKTNIPF